MDRAEKQRAVALLSQKLASSKLALLAEFRGLTVRQATLLRSQLRRSQGEYLVVKNTLAHIALENSEYGAIKPLLAGPTGWVFCQGDALPVVKLVVKFATEVEGFSIKGGVFEGGFLDAAGVKELSQLPDRDHLLSQLLSLIQGCGTRLVRMLSEPSSRLVRLLSEVRKLKRHE